MFAMYLFLQTLSPEDEFSRLGLPNSVVVQQAVFISQSVEIPKKIQDLLVQKGSPRLQHG